MRRASVQCPEIPEGICPRPLNSQERCRMLQAQLLKIWHLKVEVGQRLRQSLCQREGVRAPPPKQQALRTAVSTPHAINGSGAFSNVRGLLTAVGSAPDCLRGGGKCLQGTEPRPAAPKRSICICVAAAACFYSSLATFARGQPTCEKTG